MKRLKEWTVRKVSGTPFWIVDESFFWIIDYTEKSWVIIAEKGFVSNYWSIPRLLRFIFDPTRYNSYIIHDKLYEQKMAFNQHTHEYRLVSRAEADKILLEWIAYEWAKFFERLFIYLGVRIGGWIAWEFWKKIRLDDIKE